MNQAFAPSCQLLHCQGQHRFVLIEKVPYTLNSRTFDHLDVPYALLRGHLHTPYYQEQERLTEMMPWLTLKLMRTL